jgi:hypothetical protein
VLHNGLIPTETTLVPEDAKSGFSEDSFGLVQPGDIVCNSITVKNTQYTKNMLVILKVINQDRVQTGWIQKVIVRKKEVLFLVNSKVCRRTKMRYFQSEEMRGELQLKSVASLKSFKPLIPRGNVGFFVFFLYGKLQDDFAQ